MIFDEKDAHHEREMMLKQHNTITSGRYDFTSAQLDIMFMLLSQLKEDKITYRIHAKDIELLTGRTWNYQQLRKSTEDIGSRMFEIEGEGFYEQIWLFQKVKYLHGEGAFEVMISEPAKPLFFELKNNFTHFQLRSVLNCSSSYAKRLYMIACQWKRVGRFPRPMPIVDFKKMLGLVDGKGNEQYSEITGFKKKVLDIAKKQINEHTDITFDYELFKRGRSYQFIQIYVNLSKQNPQQLSIDFKKPLAEQKDIRRIMAYGLSEKQATQIAQNVKIEEFMKLINELNQKVVKGDLKVENSVGYIVGVYKKKGVITE